MSDLVSRACAYLNTPIMLHNIELAQDFDRDLFAGGVSCIGFSHPVVPKGEARIRIRFSAAHEPDHIDRAIAAFTKAGRAYDVLNRTKDQIITRYGL